MRAMFLLSTLVLSTLLLVGACTAGGNWSNDNTASLDRYVEPTDGAAYSQGDVRYYENNVNPYGAGGGVEVRHK